MKQILASLLFCCAFMVASAQEIHTSPSCFTSIITVGKSYITASGLTPASGTLTVAPTSPKFMVSLDSTSWDFSINISYSGGTLPSTPVYILYAGPTGLPNWTWVNVSGGGAIATNIVACANTTSCPCSTTGVSDLTGNPSISILPNPAISQITIQSTNRAINDIVITNMVGQEIFAHKYGVEKVQVDVSAFAPGMYMVRINGTEIRKFIKE